jgi:hypothetical protein
LSYVHTGQLFVGTFVSSFWHERTSTDGKIYTKMQMQDLFDGFFTLITYKPYYNQGVYLLGTFT